MKIGEFNRRVILQRPVDDGVEDGEALVEWTAYATVWAAIRPVTAREQLRSGTVDSSNRIVVGIRYRNDVTAKDRLLYGTRTFEINGVMNLNEGNTEMELLCTELAA